MTSLGQEIAARATALPEGAPLTAKAFLHLGSRAAVDQVLSRLARKGTLLRIGRGVYVRPILSRYGMHSPSTPKVIEGLANHIGEPIAVSGATAANALGLTTQVPAKEVYLTSGRNRRLKLGARTVEVRHAPAWQLVLPGHVAGDVVRALAWMGPERSGTAIGKLRTRLSAAELEEVAGTRPRLPTWMAQQVSALVHHA